MSTREGAENEGDVMGVREKIGDGVKEGAKAERQVGSDVEGVKEAIDV